MVVEDLLQQNTGLLFVKSRLDNHDLCSDSGTVFCSSYPTWKGMSEQNFDSPSQPTESFYVKQRLAYDIYLLQNKQIIFKINEL